MFGHNTVDNRDTDGNGHGTHVAGMKSSILSLYFMK